MTKQQIMRTIKEENNNPSIKWSVVENTPERITVRDNLQGSNVAGLLKGTSKWDDYEETEQGLLKGVAIAVHNFNYLY